MMWLHERGLISSWKDYQELPIRVLADARMLMYREAESQKKAKPLPGRKR